MGVGRRPKAGEEVASLELAALADSSFGSRGSFAPPSDGIEESHPTSPRAEMELGRRGELDRLIELVVAARGDATLAACGRADACGRQRASRTRPTWSESECLGRLTARAGVGMGTGAEVEGLESFARFLDGPGAELVGVSLRKLMPTFEA